ncbi:MAG: nuclear transport factor 2 family protein [Candidatus Cloacimonadota bacterium]|nr:MAG: nuclear transport factor 2 family protein [Candidatus Cloacimonadota bacterium]RLC51807.1 MAG: nuclear transport factor 2 family protein [Candidatus Cloacimonadota bacterium]
MRRFQPIVIVISIIMTLMLVSCENQVEPVDGEALVKEVWKAMKTTNMDFIENILADGFQSIHQDGYRDKDDEIELIKNLNMGDYVLDSFEVTKNGNTLNVSYFVNVEETIDGEVLNKRSARLSVFTRTAEGWKWFSHANLVPLKE